VTLIILLSLHMMNKKVSTEPILRISRVAETVTVDFICEGDEAYKSVEYTFNDAEDRAILFEKEMTWVSNRVSGTDFSFYANDEEVIIDHSELVSISIATGFAGCEFKEHLSF